MLRYITPAPSWLQIHRDIIDVRRSVYTEPPPTPYPRPPLPVGVLNVQPDDVVRDLMVVEARVHGVHVGLVPVVPAALVIPVRGEGRGETCEERTEAWEGGRRHW